MDNATKKKLEGMDERMKVSDLKTGMVVEVRNGSKYLVLRNVGIGKEQNDVMIHPYENSNGWMNIDDYHDDLTCWGHERMFGKGKIVHHPAFDIVKVYKAYHVCDVGFTEKYQLIFERKETEDK